MNTKTVPTSLLALFATFLVSCFSSSGIELEEKVVALVTRIDAPLKDSSETVTLWMTIHSPRRFGGFEFIVVTESKERTKVKVEFPIGSLQTLRLPDKTTKALEDQIEGYASIDKQLDSGINPMWMSQAVSVPFVKFSELTMKPIASRVVTKQAEDASGGNVEKLR